MEKIRKIQKKKLLLVEGKDEEGFFEVLFKDKAIQGIQVMESGGKEQFVKLLPEIIKLPDFNRVSSLAVIQDADQGAQATFESICSVLNNSNLSVPEKPESFTSNSPRIGVFIIFDKNNQGMLESLCLSTVESKNLMNCIDSFMQCVEDNPDLNKNGRYQKPKNLHKARCRAFLAAMEGDTPSLGVAAKKGYWNLNSTKLQSLLDFLKKL